MGSLSGLVQREGMADENLKPMMATVEKSIFLSYIGAL